MEFVGRTIWGERRYQHEVDEKCTPEKQGRSSR